MSKQSQEKPEIKKLTEEELNALYGRIDDGLTKEDAELIKKLIKFTFWIQGKFQLDRYVREDRHICRRSSTSGGRCRM